MNPLAQWIARRPVLLIFVFAWVLRTLFVVIALDAGADFTLTKDSPRYDRLALNLLHRGQFKAEPFSLEELGLPADFERRVLQPGYLTGTELFAGPEIKRVPLFPTFLAAIYGMFGYDPRTVLMLQALIGAVTCWLVYRIGADAGHSSIGMLAGLLLAMNPRSILHTGQLQVETCFIAVQVAVVWIALRRAARPNTARTTALAIALLVLTLSREMGLLMPAIFLPIVIAPVWRAPSGHRLREVCKAVLLLAVPLLGILGWMARNHSHYGIFAWTAHTPFTEAWHFGPRILSAAWDVPEREAQERILSEVVAAHPEYLEDYHRFMADPYFSVWEFNHSLRLNRDAADIVRPHLLEHWPTTVSSVATGALWSLWSGVGEWRGIVISPERYKAAAGDDRVERSKRALFQLRPTVAWQLLEPVLGNLGWKVGLVLCGVTLFMAVLYAAAILGVPMMARLDVFLATQLVLLVLFAGFVSGPAGNNRLFAIAYPFLSLLGAAGVIAAKERLGHTHSASAGGGARSQ